MSRIYSTLLIAGAVAITALPAMAAKTAVAPAKSTTAVCSHKCKAKTGTAKIKTVNPLKKVK